MPLDTSVSLGCRRDTASVNSNSGFADAPSLLTTSSTGKDLHAPVPSQLASPSRRISTLALRATASTVGPGEWALSKNLSILYSILTPAVDGAATPTRTGTATRITGEHFSTLTCLKPQTTARAYTIAPRSKRHDGSFSSGLFP